MSTKNPRLMVVLEPPLYKWVKRTAKKEGTSISTKVRDLIREAYESYEDLYWSRTGEARLSSFTKKHSLTHEQVWTKK